MIQLAFTSQSCRISVTKVLNTLKRVVIIVAPFLQRERLFHWVQFFWCHWRPNGLHSPIRPLFSQIVCQRISCPWEIETNWNCWLLEWGVYHCLPNASHSSECSRPVCSQAKSLDRLDRYTGGFPRLHFLSFCTILSYHVRFVPATKRINAFGQFGLGLHFQLSFCSISVCSLADTQRLDFWFFRTYSTDILSIPSWMQIRHMGCGASMRMLCEGLGPPLPGTAIAIGGVLLYSLTKASLGAMRHLRYLREDSQLLGCFSS